MAQIRVCHITTVHNPFDDRIFHKECKALLQAEYEVILIAQYPRNITVEGINIKGLPVSRNRIHRMICLTFKAFLIALKQKASIYHFHDPELLPIGILLKIFTLKKVFYDVHEDVSKQIKSKDWIHNRRVREIVARLFYYFEKFSVNFFDKIIAATPDISRNFPNNKTTLIRNLVILGLSDNQDQKFSSGKIRPSVIYAGGLARSRGIYELIEAMEMVGDKCELWLLGTWEDNDFKKCCEALKGWEYTRYFGFKPLEEVYSYMKAASIGISALHPLENYITSLPVKAFEYMACSLPMVISAFPYWQVTFRNCAIFVNPLDPEDIARGIRYLLNDSCKSKELGMNGRALVTSQYSWESESRELTLAYQLALAKCI